MLLSGKEEIDWKVIAPAKVTNSNNNCVISEKGVIWILPK